MRSVLVCVRTAAAAQAVMACADRLGAGAVVRTAVTASEVLSRLVERPTDTVLLDTALTRPDPVSFVRRALAQVPGATLVLYGPESPQVAAAAVAAGARGVIRGGDDIVATVARTLMLLSLPLAPGSIPAGRGGTAPGMAFGGGTLTAHIGHPPTNGVLAGHPAGAARVELARAGTDLRAGSAPLPAGIEAPDTLVPAQRGDQIPTRRVAALTERELQVLRGMADGKSNAEIGRDLFVSEDTVKTHARRLFRKLGARDRAHAVAAGFRGGLVS